LPKLVTTSGWGGTEIRQFNDSGIQKSIDRALAELPAGKKGAVVAYYDVKTRKMSGAVVARLGRNWSVVGSLRHRVGAPLADLEGGAAVRFTW
jgi:hypothetical protein